MKDVRSRKVAFLAYCLLDQNARAKATAKHPGSVSEIVKTLITNGVGMVQMPCPELLHGGFQRAPRSKDWYDNEEFRGVCRRYAKQVAERIEKYVENRYQVVGIVGVEHSPSCAVKVLPVIKNGKRRWVRSQGIFIEELLEELGSRGLDKIPMIGAYIDKRRIRSTCRRLEKAVTQAGNFTVRTRDQNIFIFDR